jgi:hypothetical protein
MRISLWIRPHVNKGQCNQGSLHGMGVCNVRQESGTAPLPKKSPVPLPLHALHWPTLDCALLLTNPSCKGPLGQTATPLFVKCTAVVTTVVNVPLRLPIRGAGKVAGQDTLQPQLAIIWSGGSACRSEVTSAAIAVMMVDCEMAAGSGMPGHGLLGEKTGNMPATPYVTCGIFFGSRSGHSEQVAVTETVRMDDNVANSGPCDCPQSV